VDRTSARVTTLGGQVRFPGIETPGVARTALVASPEGAVFGLWEPRQVVGVDVQDRTGSMWWVELATADKDAAHRFYSDLFGWSVEQRTKYALPRAYTLFKAGDVSAAGAFQFDPDWEVSPSWQVYFAIDDYDGILKRAESMGGEPGFHREVPDVGHLSVITDPSDALFLVMRPNSPAE
jgi:predicted enzyme related to lactoylglutathione lyase